MANRITFTYAQKKEIKRKFAKLRYKSTVDVKGFRRLTALHMRVLGRKNADIAEVLGFSEQYITELVSKYINKGMDSIIIDKRTSNNRRMSFDEEVKFLEQFVEIAEAGQVITVEGILKKFEEVTGKPSNSMTIYKLLKRHGWRKVKPRPRHPNSATEAEKEASKKLTKSTEHSYWKKIEGTSETSTSNTSGFD